MRLSLRFIVPLILALAAVAYGVVPLVDRLALGWFTRDLEMRSSLLSTSLHDPLLEQLRNGNKTKITRFFGKLSQDERLYAVGFCQEGKDSPLATATLPKDIRCDELERFVGKGKQLLQSDHGLLHVSVKPLVEESETLGQLILVHDMSFIERRSEETKKYLFYFFVALGALISLITVVIAQLSWRGWINGIRALLRGDMALRPEEKSHLPELRPLAKDLQGLIRELEEEFRPRDDSRITWTPAALRRILKEDLSGDDILVVSNREPYIHVRKGDALEVQQPASGLVTALEPVMRACSGTWIAHGSGSGDREAVDGKDGVDVPPDHPAYRLRRVWLSAEEEAGYYFGFANEGLWPLCHMAHVRPIFRTEDWEHYVRVNRKFAQAVAEEAKTPNPIVLVQDYHFALLPRMVRELLPDATIITFWHIPWPNPETFSICPWREEILDGMLGSSILGFHTQFHCNNFFDSVDRLLEARLDKETFTVSYGGQLTAVKRYPISIAWPPFDASAIPPAAQCRENVLQRHGLPADARIGVGVDRLDYTKGILERFRAVERLLELEPGWIGKFTFIQIAAPTRSSIGEYQDFEAQVRALAEQINQRFGADGYRPLLLKIEHHGPKQVYEYYRAADLCVVSSLHDGMNLVAKEFVAAREDERGVLVLSQFTGASRELPEALVVNPYDIDQCAAALHLALSMSEREQRERMRIMRSLVREFNVYRWAGRMLLDAAGMRKRSGVQKRAAGDLARKAS